MYSKTIIQSVEKRAYQMMKGCGISYETGFMPETPFNGIPCRTGDIMRDSYLARIHRLASCLPKLTETNDVVSAVDQLTVPDWPVNDLSKETRYHLFLDAGMVMHAYFREKLGYSTVQELYADESVKYMPAQLAIPLWKLGKITGMDPTLSYILLGLWNHEKEPGYDPTKPEHFRAIHTFTGKGDEKWFLQVHDAVQATEAPAYPPLLRAYFLSWYPFEHIPPDYMIACLKEAAPPLLERVAVLKRMGEYMDPGTYFDRVRMFYPFPKNVIYEGVKEVWALPQNFGGQTGGNRQSQQVEDNIMGVVHTESSQDYRRAMRQKMPTESRELILRLENSRVREFVLANRDNRELVMSYNLVIFAMVDWGIEHDNQAFGNIGKFGEVRGTGGPHLTLLRDMFMSRRDALIY
jgi:indoleamine 2,3-dioxygenase